MSLTVLTMSIMKTQLKHKLVSQLLLKCSVRIIQTKLIWSLIMLVTQCKMFNYMKTRNLLRTSNILIIDNNMFYRYWFKYCVLLVYEITWFRTLIVPTMHSLIDNWLLSVPICVGRCWIVNISADDKHGGKFIII